MRFKYTFVVLLIAVVNTTTLPVTGQEEPLPAIQVKTTFEAVTPSVALAVEPIRDLARQTTLADAARANDYAAFDALYRQAPIPAFAMLYELWTFSMTDPVGAFYGQETYARLARAYPGFGRFIDDYRIVDSNGNVFYPTSETRAFLLRQAILGTPAATTRVQIAERETAPAPRRRVVEETAVREDSAAPNVAAPKVVAPNVVAPKVSAAKPVAKGREIAVASHSEVLRSAQDDSGRAPVVIAEPQPTSVATPVAAAQPPVVIQSKPEPTAITVDNSFGTRGIFLLLIGIFGIGILAMMLRAPSELPTSIITPPAETQLPPPVEPLRRPTAATPQPPPPAGKNRAGGSHG